MRYKLSGILAASAGDTRDLCRHLRDPSVMAMPERLFAADLIEKKIKRPRHRLASLLTVLRHKDIARRVEELTRKPGEREAAIVAAMTEFKCSRSTVLTALRAHRVK